MGLGIAGRPIQVREGARIAIVAAGGTIASAPDERGALQATERGETLLSRVLAAKPGLDARFRLRVRHAWSLLSEDLHPADWSALARAIAAELAHEDDPPYGVVVTHGTDTLTYSASAVAFMLDGLGIPVVFTGALRPASAPRSDAAQNFHDAVVLAANVECAGVFIAFGQVTLATQTSPMPPYGRSFPPADRAVAGRVTTDGQVAVTDGLRRRLSPRADIGSASPDGRIDDRVKLVKVYPGLRPDDLVAIAGEDCRAVVLELFHSGTACTRDALSLVPPIAACTRRGVLVYGLPSHQALENRQVYASTRALIDAGMIALPRILPETALVKLMWLLGHERNPDRVTELMRTDLRGEILSSAG